MSESYRPWGVLGLVVVIALLMDMLVTIALSDQLASVTTGLFNHMMSNR
jgi:hypothetical protein